MKEINLARIEKMEKLINKALAPAYLNIVDDSHLHVGHAGAKSGAGHFSVFVHASSFKGKSVLAQHRLVYQALDSMMPQEIHALSIHTKDVE